MVMIRSEYIGKEVKIITTDEVGYCGTVVEVEGPEDTESGEPEIGINFAGGIRMFTESEIISIYCEN